MAGQSVRMVAGINFDILTSFCIHMTVIQNQIVVDKPVDQVYAFLADCNNHEQLMPDNVYNWTSTTDEASFTIQNMAKLTLKVDRRVEEREVLFIPAEKAPFNVVLRWETTSPAVNQTLARLVIEAELNMMMKMVASGPLQKLVDHQVSRLKSLMA